MKRSIKSRVVQAMAPRARIAGVIAAVMAAGLFTASCDVHGLSAPGTLSAIVVSPNPQSLAINGTQQFTAVGTDFSGATVSFTPVWTVVSGGGAISSSGVFTAGTTPGTFTNTVMATSGGKSGTATVLVTVGPLASITLTPSPTSLVVGTTQQYVAVGKDAGGNIVQFTPTYSVLAGGGSINGTGMFTAGMVTGTFVNAIQASSGGISATATVTQTAGPLATIVVTPNPIVLNTGAAQQFTAVGKDASGNAVAITPVWSVANGGGSINSAGLFTAGNTPGTFTNTVTATSGGLSGTATVVVTAGPVATITVTPNPVTLVAGATQQFSAVGRDGGGNIVQITPTWSVVNGGGTINSSSGVFTAGAVAGTFTNTVQATSGGVSGTATVTVTAPPPVVATITVTPNPAFVQANGVQQFSAVGRDGNGNIVAISPTWSVIAGGGTIDPVTGIFTAGPTAGTFTNTVRAVSNGVAGTATVTVTTTPPALMSITVTPNPAAVLTNGTQQFIATGRDGNGNVLAIQPTFAWSVVNGGGTIDPVSGLFTAGAVAGTYTNTVKATSGGVSGFATVTETAVAPAPLINFGTAALNGIMAGTAVSCSSLGLINADVSISPGNTISGFPPCTITGVQHLNDATAVQNQIDLTAAYNQLAGLPCPPSNFISADLGGTTKLPGVYCSASTLGLTGVLTLDGNGDPNSNFVFQAGSSLTTAGSVVLINGAQAKNVYFQVGSSATIGTASNIQGNIVALTSISLLDNATLVGRALARNGAVSLTTGNTITLP